jgi:hypothetical protein
MNQLKPNQMDNKNNLDRNVSYNSDKIVFKLKNAIFAMRSELERLPADGS